MAASQSFAVSSRRPAHSNAHGSSDKPAVEHPRIAWDKALGIAKSGAAACEAMVRTLGAWLTEPVRTG